MAVERVIDSDGFFWLHNRGGYKAPGNNPWTIYNDAVILSDEEVREVLYKGVKTPNSYDDYLTPLPSWGQQALHNDEDTAHTPSEGALLVSKNSQIPRVLYQYRGGRIYKVRDSKGKWVPKSEQTNYSYTRGRLKYPNLAKTDPDLYALFNT